MEQTVGFCVTSDEFVLTKSNNWGRVITADIAIMEMADAVKMVALANMAESSLFCEGAVVGIKPVTIKIG